METKKTTKKKKTKREREEEAKAKRYRENGLPTGAELDEDSAIESLLDRGEITEEEFDSKTREELLALAGKGTPKFGERLDSIAKEIEEATDRRREDEARARAFERATKNEKSDEPKTDSERYDELFDDLPTLSFEVDELERELGEARAIFARAEKEFEKLEEKFEKEAKEKKTKSATKRKRKSATK